MSRSDLLTLFDLVDSLIAEFANGDSAEREKLARIFHQVVADYSGVANWLA